MVNLNVYTSHSNSRPIDRSVSPPGPPRVPSAEASAAAEGGGTDSTISILARQLNEAATRADAREAGLDRRDSGGTWRADETVYRTTIRMQSVDI